MNKKRKSAANRASEYGTSVLTKNRNKKRYFFEDVSTGIYRRLISKLVTKDEFNNMQISQPKLKDFEYVDSDFQTGGKEAVLKLHDEYKMRNNNNGFFFVDQDFDLVMDKFSEEHKDSEQLHILNSYCFENYFVFEEIANDMIGALVRDKDKCTTPNQLRDLLKYDKWKKQKINEFRELLPVFLSIKEYNDQCITDEEMIRIPYAEADVEKLFNIESPNTNLIAGYFESVYLKPNSEKLSNEIKKYSKIIEEMNDDEVFKIIPGKLLMKCFSFYLHKKSIHFCYPCTRECKKCDRVCNKITYFENIKKFRSDKWLHLLENEELNSTKDFIIKNAKKI